MSAARLLNTRAALITALLLAALSLGMRAHLAATRPLAGQLDGQEPEAHEIVTERAFARVPATVHHFLPLFTLGAPSDKFIDQHPGSAYGDPQGNFYFTSQPPLSFVYPYVFSKIFDRGEPTLVSLRWFNMSLQIAATAALAWLCWLAARARGLDRDRSAGAAAAAAAVYLSAPTCLLSHTLGYWGQTVEAVFLPLQVAVALFVPNPAAAFVLAFFSCLTDWTAYVATAAAVACGAWFWINHADGRRARCAVFAAAGGTLGGLAMLAWYWTIIPFSFYFHALSVRGSARGLDYGHGGIAAQLSDLALRDLASIGFLLPVLAFGLAALLFARRAALPVAEQPAGMKQWNHFFAAFVLLLCATAENILCADHAVRYAYDRLKVVQVLALVTAWLCAALSRRAAGRLLATVYVASVLNVLLFFVGYDSKFGWSTVPVSIEERIGTVIRETAPRGRPVFLGNWLRGAEIYYADRNIVQADFSSDTAVLVRFAAGWCRDHGFTDGWLYQLSADSLHPAPSQIPRTLHVLHVLADGSVAERRDVQLQEKRGDLHAMNALHGLDPYLDLGRGEISRPWTNEGPYSP